MNENFPRPLQRKGPKGTPTSSKNSNFLGFRPHSHNPELWLPLVPILGDPRGAHELTVLALEAQASIGTTTPARGCEEAEVPAQSSDPRTPAASSANISSTAFTP